ncbi:MAG: hypothetical protein ABI889_10150 [Gemmatimonadota bacterium]
MSVLKLASMVAVFGAIVSTTACKNNGDTTTKGVDTMVTTTKVPVRDTTIVKADTTIHTDTVKKTDHAADVKNKP